MKRKLTILFVSLICCGVSISAEEADVFPMSSSVLLFGRHNELRLVTPDGVKVIKPPSQVPANSGYFAYPSISQSGDVVAWGFAVDWQRDQNKPKAKFALGVLSLHNEKWKTFGDFDDIGAAAFSSDGSKVAFVADKDGKRELFILDMSTERIANARYPKGMPKSATLSWAPDGKRLAVEIERGEKNSVVGVLDLALGNVQVIGEGFNPAWSPTGDWIAFFDPSGAKCVLVHPDGTGFKVLRTLQPSRRFGWGSPVWSPDGTQILLDEMKGKGDFSDAVLLNLRNGSAQIKARNAIPVFGWAARK